MQNLIPALIKARGEFGTIQKDKTNPHYKSKYATLDAVLDAVTPALCKHGLAIIQSTSTESGKTELKTYLYHESGEYLNSSYPLPDIADAQKLGAALTYARRYALCALLSVTADEDDDGNSVATKVHQQAKPQTKPQSAKHPEHNEIVKAVRAKTGHQPEDITAFCQANYKRSRPDELSPEQLNQLVRALVIGWAEPDFENTELAATAYDGHVGTLVASGQSLQSAVMSWIEKVKFQSTEVDNSNYSFTPEEAEHLNPTVY